MRWHETPEWARYLTLREQRPAAFQDGALEIVTEADTVDRFAEASGKRLGVLYESPYHLLVVDLVKPVGADERRMFAYERLLPAVESGAVVAMPLYGDRLVLLRQFRHAPREDMLSFPRGFGEPGLSGRDNLRKELFEEIGAPEVTEIHYLGTVAADSGILGTRAEVFLCHVDRPQLRRGYEGIEAVELLSERELSARIASGGVTDGYTLAAFALYVSQKNGKE
ncbi:MAG: NUDIX hydrolase [Ruminococcaceae bacterium]|nr:NUDIX hydrolase [Oscillospiraceae bacterium]